MLDHAVFSSSVHALKNEEQRVSILGVEELLQLGEAFEPLVEMALGFLFRLERVGIVGRVAFERRSIVRTDAEAICIQRLSLP
jgi:hypothetical protein